MTDLMTIARAEATQEVAGAITKAAGVAMQRHGNDEHKYAISILAAGFVMAMRAIGKNIDHRFLTIVKTMLDEGSSR